MGCLSSANLKEREVVLASGFMFAQRHSNSWSRLLTSRLLRGGAKADPRAGSNRRAMSLSGNMGW